jgi:hypothetical protein
MSCQWRTDCFPVRRGGSRKKKSFFMRRGHPDSVGDARRFVTNYAFLHQSAFDAVDGAYTAASGWHRMVASKRYNEPKVMLPT